MTVLNRARAMRRASMLSACAVAVTLALAGCGGGDAPSGDTPVPAKSTATAPAVTPDTAVSEKVAAMSVQELSEAARVAYAENRLYAPAGDNAVEYYLVLRDKAPNDPAVASALTDLLPMTVIAVEQSVGREDFPEAQRLTALLEKADGQHPALARLKGSITTEQAAAAQRAEQEKLTAEQEAQRQQELEREREAAQQQQQQQAAQQLAAQQATERQQAAERQAAEQRAAAQRAEEQRLAEQRAAEQRQQQQQQAAAAAPAGNDLRAISTPAPRYPPDALRAGTSGEVQVEFTVAPDGSVTAARVVRASPARIFDREAINAVRRWRFQPPGAPVTTRRTISFNPGG